MMKRSFIWFRRYTFRPDHKDTLLSFKQLISLLKESEGDGCQKHLKNYLNNYRS
jgi:hypothetical protein